MKDTVETIIKREINKLEEMSSNSDEPLGRNEAQMLNDYMKTLIASKKDERETSKSEALATIADEDLDDLAKEALAFLKGGSDEG